MSIMGRVAKNGNRLDLTELKYEMERWIDWDRVEQMSDDCIVFARNKGTVWVYADGKVLGLDTIPSHVHNKFNLVINDCRVGP